MTSPRTTEASQWPRARLGRLVHEMGGATPPKDRGEFWNGGIPWVSPKDMKSEVISDSIDHVSDLAVAQTSLRIVPEGAVLLVVRGMILAHTVPVAQTVVPVTVNQDMKALAPSRKISGAFLRYSLQAHQDHLLGLVEEAGHGTRCLRSELWRRFEVPVPPLATQNAIAAFLDRKTAAIDALIEKKQKLLELLAEKRAALINQAVTKGLDPNVPMKDSGIPSIGLIPKHWQLTKPKFEALVRTSNSGKSAVLGENGPSKIEYLRAQNRPISRPGDFLGRVRARGQGHGERRRRDPPAWERPRA